MDDYDGGYGMVESCPTCGYGLVWTDCDVCGGEGEYDVYEDDPLWYDPVDTEECHQCGGDGGWAMCPNKACKVGLVDLKTLYKASESPDRL